jgi:hypothetical protein
LARSDNADIATRAKNVLAANRHQPLRPLAPERAAMARDIRINTYPAGATLPASFTGQYARLAEGLDHCKDEHACTARLIDLDGDGQSEVLVGGEMSASAFKRETDGRWMEWVMYRAPECDNDDSFNVAEAVGSPRLTTAPPIFPDLVIGGVRLRRQEGELECPAPPDPAP